MLTDTAPAPDRSTRAVSSRSLSKKMTTTIPCDRYVERNPLRANLVERAEQWRWSSLGRFTMGDDGARRLLAAWPIPRPADWASRVNRAESKKELEALRRSVQRGQPYGGE